MLRQLSCYVLFFMCNNYEAFADQVVGGKGVSVANQLTDIGNWNSRFLQRTTTHVCVWVCRLDDCEIRWRRRRLAMLMEMEIELLMMTRWHRVVRLHICIWYVSLIRGAWLTDWLNERLSNNWHGTDTVSPSVLPLSLCMQYKFYMHKYTSVLQSVRVRVCVCIFIYRNNL